MWLVELSSLHLLLRLTVACCFDPCTGETAKDSRLRADEKPDPTLASGFSFLSKNKLNIADIDNTDVSRIADFENPENKMQLSEIQKRINNCVNELPPQCSMVFKLIKEEGFSYKKVSGILEISQNTIEYHMRIALKKIRISLSKYLSEK